MKQTQQIMNFDGSLLLDSCSHQGGSPYLCGSHCTSRLSVFEQVQYVEEPYLQQPMMQYVEQPYVEQPYVEQPMMQYEQPILQPVLKPVYQVARVRHCLLAARGIACCSSQRENVSGSLINACQLR